MEVQVCERCGTFAALTSNGFRSLCEPCWRFERHPLERTGLGVGQLLGTLGRLVVDGWKPIGLLVLGKALVPALVVLLWGEPKLWFTLPYDVAVGSAFEALLLSTLAQRAFSGRWGLSVAMARARARYLSVLGVNALSALAFSLGLLLLCVPGVVVATLLWSAVPIALFEEVGPIGALRMSLQRMRPVFWPMVVIALVFITVSALPAMVNGAVQGYFVAAQRAAPPGLLQVIGACREFASAALSAPSMIFQLVAWSVTRPARGPTPPLEGA